MADTDKMFKQYKAGRSLIGIASNNRCSTTEVIMVLIRMGANPRVVDQMIKEPRSRRDEEKEDVYVVKTPFHEHTPNKCRLLAGMETTNPILVPHCEGCQCYLRKK